MNKFSRQTIPILLGVLVMLYGMVGCSPRAPRSYDPHRTPAAGTPEEAVNVSRSALKAAIDRVALTNQLRVVPVYRRNEEYARVAPEYRLFNIAPQSAYALLGLRESDTVIAANGFVLHNGDLFREYVRLLPKEREGFVELRRAGTPLILRFRFIE